MKRFVVAFGLLLLASSAHADPYRWCAEYGGFRGGGGTNCYFRTLGQCQAAVSGVGGFCRPNQFYTGETGRKRSTTGSGGYRQR